MEPRKRYRLSNIAKGLCKKCPRKAVAYHLCFFHLEKHREHAKIEMKRLRMKRREKHLCVKCGIKLDQETDSKYSCINCNERHFIR